MSQKKNEGILFPTEIRVVGSYTDRLLNLDHLSYYNIIFYPGYQQLFETEKPRLI